METTEEKTKKKYDVGIQLLNKYEVEAYSEWEAIEIVNNMDSRHHLLDCAYRIRYIYEK